MYQQQADDWKREHLDEWVGRSISANMEYYSTHSDLPRHELITFVPFLDGDNFRHGGCDDYGVEESSLDGATLKYSRYGDETLMDVYFRPTEEKEPGNSPDGSWDWNLSP
ncbi:3835_t:CDS:1, partial [Paraglomus occultum]